MVVNYSQTGQQPEPTSRAGLLAKDTRDNVIRFSPTLVIAQNAIDWALEKIERVLTTTC